MGGGWRGSLKGGKLLCQAGWVRALDRRNPIRLPAVLTEREYKASVSSNIFYAPQWGYAHTEASAIAGIRDKGRASGKVLRGTPILWVLGVPWGSLGLLKDLKMISAPRSFCGTPAPPCPGDAEVPNQFNPDTHCSSDTGLSCVQQCNSHARRRP